MCLNNHEVIELMNVYDIGLKRKMKDEYVVSMHIDIPPKLRTKDVVCCLILSLFYCNLLFSYNGHSSDCYIVLFRESLHS